jgi:hypothetical protein
VTAFFNNDQDNLGTILAAAVTGSGHFDLIVVFGNRLGHRLLIAAI